MKKILYSMAVMAICLTACEKAAISPLVSEAPEISAMNFPSTLIAGMTIRVASQGVQRADTSNMYLRPISGGEDIKVVYGDKYEPLNQYGKVPYDPHAVLFTVPDDIKDGNYHFVIKRNDGDVVVKRTSIPVFGAYDDLNREPVTSDHFTIFHVSAADTKKVYSVEQEISAIGDFLQASDSLQLVEHIANAQLYKKRYKTEQIAYSIGKELVVRIPTGCPSGDYDLVVRRRKQDLVLKTISVKDPLKIENVVLPESAISAGTEVEINCSGVLEGDKIHLVLPDRTVEPVEDVTVSNEGIKFNVPNSVTSGPVRVELYRNDEEPVFNIGYLSFNSAVEITGIPESGFGSIPSKIPSGYPFSVDGKIQEFKLNIRGTGFCPTDKIRFNGKLYACHVTTNSLEVTLETKWITSPSQKIELVRGSASTVLREVEVVSAPKVGDYAEGGVVIWVDPIDRTHGLVCDVKDYQNGNDPKLMFATKPGIGSSDTDIRASTKNTELILKTFENNAPAAQYCSDLVVSVGDHAYDDWALPSQNALVRMKDYVATINRVSKAHGGTPMNMTKANFSVCFGYASSTQETALNVCSMTLFNSNKIPEVAMVPISNWFFVRAVRNY